MPTPARAAISRTGTLTPDSTNAAAAASSSVASFRRASARFRGAAARDPLSPPAAIQLPPSRSIARLVKRNKVPYLGYRNTVPLIQDARSGELHATRTSAQFRDHDRPHAGRLPGHPAGLA